MVFWVSWEGESETGNFRHYVDWKSEFDSTPKNHLQTAPKNAMYLSPAIQNELIECCAIDIRETLLKEVKEAKFFSVLADESVDISRCQYVYAMSVTRTRELR